MYVYVCKPGGEGKKFLVQSHRPTTQELLFRSKTRLLKDRSLIRRDFCASAYCLFSPIIHYVCPYPLPSPHQKLLFSYVLDLRFSGGEQCVFRGIRKKKMAKSVLQRSSRDHFSCYLLIFNVYRSPFYVNAMLNHSYGFFSSY